MNTSVTEKITVTYECELGPLDLTETSPEYGYGACDGLWDMGFSVMECHMVTVGDAVIGYIAQCVLWLDDHARDVWYVRTDRGGWVRQFGVRSTQHALEGLLNEWANG